jgi:hypothetical protein
MENIKDILISDGNFGKTIYDQIKYKNLEYINLDRMEDIKEEQYRFLHFCVTYSDKFFYILEQYVKKFKVIIIHKPVEYDPLIKFQRSTKIPIIYVPYNNSKTWYWSMIGEFSDALFMPFKKILYDVGIKEEHHVLIGL